MEEHQRRADRPAPSLALTPGVWLVATRSVETLTSSSVSAAAVALSGGAAHGAPSGQMPNSMTRAWAARDPDACGVC
jgi:hypothetical protein